MSQGSIATIQANANQQRVTLTFPQTLMPGPYELELSFVGKINSHPSGLYYTEYPTAQGQKRLLATQMEPISARRLFPGWDDPAYRATFQLTLVLPQQFKAVSNTPILQEMALDRDLKRVTFAPTPKMSSYLVVLVAGELDAIASTAETVALRVITTAGRQEQGRYALESSKALLAYYNDYFGIPYPLPKLDMIAIPGSFGRAMENWDGITYNESRLLFDPTRSPQSAQERIFSVMAHEMAHQWFGNLVTMAWWDDLWLNEGFASWMGSKATDRFNPQWNVWLRAHQDKEAAMSADARRTTHPIQQTITDERQAINAFDDIT